MKNGLEGISTIAGRVLCIEDDRLNAHLITRLFEKAANVVLTVARTAEEGLDIIASELPDLILMDINLPGIDGTQALKIIRADPVAANVPVIALTADAFCCAGRYDQVSGFNAYITKPFVLSELVDVLKAYL